MADYELPDDLVADQRAFYAADAEVQRVTAALPSGMDVVNGTATITPEQRAALVAARAERGRLIAVLYNHPWFKTVEDPNAAHMALQAAARG
jgi:hypothetical protein